MLSDLSLTVLCAMIDFVPPSEDQLETMAKTSAGTRGIVLCLEGIWKEDVSVKQLATNEFQRLLSRVEGQPNYKALYGGIVRLLANFVATQNTALPNSTKEVKCFNELAIFLLRLLSVNPVSSVTSLVAFRGIPAAEGRRQAADPASALHVQQVHRGPESDTARVVDQLHRSFALLP